VSTAEQEGGSLDAEDRHDMSVLIDDRLVSDENHELMTNRSVMESAKA